MDNDFKSLNSKIHTHIQDIHDHSNTIRQKMQQLQSYYTTLLILSLLISVATIVTIVIVLSTGGVQ